MGSAPRSEAGHSRRADSGRAAWFVAELGSAGLVSGQAWKCLARVGSTGGAARRSIADLGLACGACCTRGSARSRRAGSHLGIARDSGRVRGQLGLAHAGLAAGSTGAFLGRASASVRAASSSGPRASTARCRSARAGTVLGRAGRTRTFMGRSRSLGRSATGRAGKIGFPDGALVEPAGSRMGSAQACGFDAAGAIFERLGSAAAGSKCAAANRRAIVGGARRPSCAQVRFLERAGRACVGHAEDRRAGCPCGTVMGSAGGASDGSGASPSMDPACCSHPGRALVATGRGVRASCRIAGAGPDRRRTGSRS